MIEEIVAYRTRDGSVYRDKQRAIEAEAALADYEAGQRALLAYLQPHGIEEGTPVVPFMPGPWDLRIESIYSYGGNPPQDAMDIVLTLRDALALFVAAPEPVGATP